VNVVMIIIVFWYDNNEAVGCKYCGCYDFNVKLNMMNEKLKTLELVLLYCYFHGIHNKYYPVFMSKMTNRISSFSKTILLNWSKCE
jgi:hypothetical protein